MKKVLLYIAIGAIVYYIIHRFLRRKKYLDYFKKQLGFGDIILSKFSTDELITAYSYLKNYSRKGITLSYNVAPEFYQKVKALNEKMISLSGSPIFTNIK